MKDRLKSSGNRSLSHLIDLVNLLELLDSVEAELRGDLSLRALLENIDYSHEGDIDQVELVRLDITAEGILDQALDDLVCVPLDSVVSHGVHILG